MQYSNRHLREVNCSFQFPEETTPWDSTFFGRFYEKIISLGFKEKEERKGVEIRFGVSNNSIIPNQHIEDQVIFKDGNGKAILLCKNRISFHVIKDYTIWNDFINGFINPYLDIYKSLQLGNGMRHCQLVYLNQFSLSKSEKLADYFNIVPTTNIELGTEVSTNIQKVISSGNNLLVTKFNSQLNNNNYNVNLECGAINRDINAKTQSDWTIQANSTHEPVHDFFEKIITNKLRDLIK